MSEHKVVSFFVFFSQIPDFLDSDSITRLSSRFSEIYSRRSLWIGHLSFHMARVFYASEGGLAQQNSGSFEMFSGTSLQDRFSRVRNFDSEHRILFDLDWTGSRALYYASFPTVGTIVTTEYRLAVDFVHTFEASPTIDMSGLSSLLNFSHNVGSETLFNGVRRLVANQTLTVNPDRTFFIREKTISIPERKPTGNIEARIREFRDLNNHLVTESLQDQESVVLPLSSGYDSRLILVAMSDQPKLKKRLVTATYGPKESIEVKSGRLLAEVNRLDWIHVPIDHEFLSPHYLGEIGMKFGSTLHMHGMYQLLFFDRLSKILGSQDFSITSGFMTGVPAGQHLKKLTRYFASGKRNLLGAAMSFPESGRWPPEAQSFLENNERELDMFLEHLSPHDGIASMQFDVWTRQARFVSYYPDTLEMRTRVLSPHMSPEYRDFLWQLPDDWLIDRKFITRFFKQVYPESAKISSNSHRVSKLGPRIKALGYFLDNAFQSLDLQFRMPARFRDDRIRFNAEAINAIGLKRALEPIFESKTVEHLDSSIPMLGNLMPQDAENLNLRDYLRLLVIQSISFDLDN